MSSDPHKIRTERVLFSPARIGVPEVLLIGHYHYTIAHPPLLPHSHDGVLEICFLERGRQLYTFDARTVYCLRGGEVLVARPGEIHGTGHLPEFPGRLFWLQLRWPRGGAAFLGLKADEAKALISALSKLHRQFRATSDLRARFEIALASENMPDARLRAVAFKARILELLLACIESSTRSEQASLPPPITRALHSLEGEPSGRTSISELARAGGLSESYFKALFRQSMGMPPAEFVRLLRLEQAQLQLRNTSGSVTDIAFGAGFSSSQHFATVFRKQYGCSPGAFRARGLNQSHTPKPLHGAGVSFHPTHIGVHAASPAKP